MGSTSKTVSYQYDAAENRSLMIDPDGGRTTYAYDPLNRISSLINPQAERTSYTYDANGRQTLKKLANGSRASFTYDAASNLTTLANLKSNNSVISEFNYQYDNVGNRVVSVEAGNSRVSWSYDNAYQITKEHRTGTSAYQNLFSYDAAGNRLVKNENGARTTSTYDAANQLQISLNATGTTTYSYDADGNQRLVQTPSGNRTTTIWNYENKNTIVELPTGIRNTMSYEPDGLRTTLEESTGIKKFVWDNQNYLAEADSNNDIQVVFTNAPAQYGNLISQRRGSTTSYYHYEAPGSTRELSDSTEAITDTYLYDAWGNQITSTGTTVNPFRWTGKVGYYWNEETENYYIRARTYQPDNGRWLSADPLGFLDGTNLYLAYFVPGWIDPSGMKEEEGFPFGGAGGKCKCCCADDVEIINIKNLDTKMFGHSFDAVFKIKNVKSTNVAHKDKYGDCTIEWWEKTNVPAFEWVKPNVWTDFTNDPARPRPFSLRAFKARRSLNYDKLTLHDPPALNTTVKTRNETRILYFRLKVISNPDCNCKSVSVAALATQILVMRNGKGIRPASSFKLGVKDDEL